MATITRHDYSLLRRALEIYNDECNRIKASRGENSMEVVEPDGSRGVVRTFPDLTLDEKESALKKAFGFGFHTHTEGQDGDKLREAELKLLLADLDSSADTVASVTGVRIPYRYLADRYGRGETLGMFLRMYTGITEVDKSRFDFIADEISRRETASGCRRWLRI